MDRHIVYPGSIPLDTDLLGVQRNVLVALGYLAQATLGTTTVADGLACLPSQPASMSVVVGPGSITQFGAVDTTPFGSLPAQPTQPLVRTGITLGSASFALAGPGVPGQAINYLIQANLLESDSLPLVLPYFNSAQPDQPFSGPGNTGAAQNTQRVQAVQLQVKAGAPAAAGLQPTPSVDSGWVGLYVVTTTYGQTSIGSGSIAVMPGAPFVVYKLPQLSPGTRNMAVYTPTTQGNWTAPAGARGVRLRLWGGGGPGGGGFGGAGGGGGSGGYSEGFYTVSPGQVFSVVVGSGGAGSASSGGLSKFGTIAQANGGLAGGIGNGASNPGGAGGQPAPIGTASGLLPVGSAGGDGLVLSASAWLGGAGGATFGGAGAAGVATAASATLAGRAGATPGGGGGGGVGNGGGGPGGAGLVVVEW